MAKAINTKKADLTEAAGGNIGQIREIIFGEQIKDYEKRFKALEKSITKAAGDLGKRLEEQVAGIEASLDKQATLLRADLDQRSEQSSADLAATESRLDQALKKLNAGLKELDDFASKEKAKLTENIESQMTELRALLETVAEETRTKSTQQVAALRQDSVDRKALGELLHHLADQLGGN